MKRITSTLILVMMATVIFAIPARRKPFVLKQVDGSTITVRLVGDENLHYYTTLDGTPLIKDHSSGMYRPATYYEAANIRAKHASRIKKRNAVRARRMVTRRAAGAYTGEKRGLVILVNFKDTKMKGSSTNQAFDDLFNKEGYNRNGHIGSVRDYFREQSYGQLTIDFDIVGPYTLSKNMDYYGEDYVDEYGNEYEGIDMYPGEMIIEAMRMANNDVDYKNYDWDGDGEVDQVYVIYAGYNQAHGAASNTIWPHEWDLESAHESGDGTGPLWLDGVKLNTYACSSELIGSSGTTISTIGTAVHEFSHCLGLPDFYDTEGTNFALDTWSVMSAGAYNGPEEWGEVPAGYTSYERMFAGWLTPVELESPCRITDMQPIATTPEAYIIYNGNNKNEYYMLENRQYERFDSYLYGHGMLVLHVDYDQNAWEENIVNNDANHQRLTIIPADNQFMSGKSYDGSPIATASDLAGDPYPGTSRKTALTDTSKPAATLYNANTDGRKFLGKPIEQITESAAGLISFAFMGGITIEAPELLAETDVTATAFTANWKPVENASQYTLQLKYKTSINIDDMRSLAEDFSGFASYSADGTNDISSNLDKYMQSNGWTGFKVYTSSSRVKLGSSKANGTLTSPLLDAPQTSQVTVVLSETLYSGKNTIDIEIKLLGADGSELASQTVESNKNAHVVTFSGIDQSYKVKFVPSARIYINGVDVYDGEYTADQIAAEGSIDYDKIVSFTSTSTSYTFKGLDSETEYFYRLQAVVDNYGGYWTAWKTPVATDLVPEDVNHDGKVDTQDVLAIYEWMQSSASASADSVPEDVNHDGKVDTQDVLTVYQLMQEE